MKKIIPSNFIEINFVLFPIWILPVYFLLKSFIFSPELTFLIFLILFGETHFASSFLFFFSRFNHEYISKNKLILIYVPILICVIYFIFGLKYFSYAVLIGSIASGIHVTRQSIGISRIYATQKNNIFELIIYFSSFLFLFIGFARFFQSEFFLFSNIIKMDWLFNKFFYYFASNKMILAFVVLLFSILAITEKTDYKKKLANLTGVLIYAPYCFVNNIYDAIVIGVGAHWSQYLLINYKVYFHNEKKDFSKILKYVFILVYAVIMGLLGYNRHFDKSFLKILILIPLTGQFFHYYIDAFIWKFSIKEIRENVGSRLFAN